MCKLKTEAEQFKWNKKVANKKRIVSSVIEKKGPHDERIIYKKDHTMKELYTQEILKNKQNHYEHITKRERDIISKHLSAGKRISYIAKALNRSKSSISEEIKRGWYKGR